MLNFEKGGRLIQRVLSKTQFFGLENSGWLIHRVGLYTGIYGNYISGLFVQNEPSTTASSSVQADSRFSSEIRETPLDEVYLRLQQARERTQNSIERARRLAQEARRTIEMVGRNLPNCLRSDEVMARQLQVC